MTKPKVSSSFAANEIQSEQIPPFRIVNASLRSGLASYAPLKGSTPWRASNNVATVYLCLCSVVEHNIRRCHEAVPNPGAASTCRARAAPLPPLPHLTIDWARICAWKTKLCWGGPEAEGREDSSDCAKETPKVIVNSIKEEAKEDRKREEERPQLAPSSDMFFVHLNNCFSFWNDL